MKKNECFFLEWKIFGLQKVLRTMKLIIFLLLISVISVFANKTYSQTKILNLEMKNSTVKEVLENIEDQSEFVFMYSEKLINVQRKVSVNIKNQKISNVLDELFAGTNVSFKVKDRFILLTTPEISAENLIVQQQRTVSGKVTDESGLPLPGVTVLVKGTNQGTITNSNGYYSIINVSEDATLVFSFVGMKTQEVMVDNQNTINATMEMDAIGIEEVVSIGYGIRKKESLTGAISKIDGEDIKLNPAPNISHSLGGKIPGLISVNYSGQPGADGNKILIRGLGTLGNNNPLIIVDGIEVESIDRLDPNNIESLSVLKDASAAIYGSRAANGVIIVTTKRGTKGKPTIEYGYNLGLAQPTLKPELANAYELNKFINAIFVDKNESDKQLSAADLEKLRTGSDPDNYFANTDWWNTVVGKYAPIQRHTASVRGGTEEIKYFVSVGHLDQEGIFKNGIDDLNKTITGLILTYR
jgi:TonB-dependent starch-binding outer membrane protein SusC